MDITVTEIMELADMHAHAKITDGTPAEMMPRNLLERRMEQIVSGVFGLECQLTEARLEIVSLQAQLEAVGAGGVGPLVGDTPWPNKATAQFLYDVVTAAGLVAHGKQCNALADRLGSGVMKFQAPLAPLTDEQIMAASEYYWADDIKDFTAGVKFAERHHNIIK